MRDTIHLNPRSDSSSDSMPQVLKLLFSLFATIIIHSGLLAYLLYYYLKLYYLYYLFEPIHLLSYLFATIPNTILYYLLFVKNYFIFNSISTKQQKQSHKYIQLSHILF